MNTTYIERKDSTQTLVTDYGVFNKRVAKSNDDSFIKEARSDLGFPSVSEYVYSAWVQANSGTFEI